MDATKFRRRATTIGLSTANPDKDTEFAPSSRSTRIPLRSRLSTTALPIAAKEEVDSSSLSTKCRSIRSSIGDVGTLRTRLQNRRAQINKELSAEKDISHGSAKLAKMSTNAKAKDKASHEASISDTQVQMLQAELARINSNLQAYQQEIVRDTQVPIIPIATKTTEDVNFKTDLCRIAKSHYHLEDTEEVVKAVMKLQDLRKMVALAPKDQAGIQMLYDYRNQMHFIGKRFLHPNLEYTVKFQWFDAISGVQATQRSIVYERACVLFNIAALHTQISAHQDRSTVDGIDNAIKELEKAIGLFEHIKANFSYSPTMDMSQEIIALFSDLMTAQAVEMQWEKKMLMKLDEDSIQTLVLYAQHAKAIAECYKPIRELVEEPALKEYFPPCWCALMKIKDSHYKALAHYYAAIVHHKLAVMCRKDQMMDVKSLRASIATELHFFYTAESTNTDELFSPNPLNHMGLVKTHLNCASLLHEYAQRFKRSCKDLALVDSLKKVLEEAKQRTEEKKTSFLNFYSTAMIAPAIQPAMIDVHPVIPRYDRAKTVDLFEFLGPLPAFSAENSWSAEKVVSITKEEGGLGFTLKGSRPATVCKVDKGSPAKRQGLQVNDWILKINHKDVRLLLHDDVVKCVKESSDTVELVVVTPTPLPGAKS